VALLESEAMKRSPFLLAIALAVPTFFVAEPNAAHAQVTQSYFRISILGFRCNTRTLESAISVDGAGDEVYAMANVLEISSTNTIANSLVRESHVLRRHRGPVDAPAAWRARPLPAANQSRKRRRNRRFGRRRKRA
jgi:hypothetical protein